MSEETKYFPEVERAYDYLDFLMEENIPCKFNIGNNNDATIVIQWPDEESSNDPYDDGYLEDDDEKLQNEFNDSKESE